MFGTLDKLNKTRLLTPFRKKKKHAIIKHTLDFVRLQIGAFEIKYWFCYRGRLGSIGFETDLRKRHLGYFCRCADL